MFPGAAGEPLAGRGGKRRPRRGTKGRAVVDFGAEGAKAVRKALAAGERPWVSVTVTARGRSPRPLVVSRRYKLR